MTKNQILQRFVDEFHKFGIVGSNESSLITLHSEGRKGAEHDFSIYLHIKLSTNECIQIVQYEVYFKLLKAPLHPMYKQKLFKCWSGLIELISYFTDLTVHNVSISFDSNYILFILGAII